MLLALVALTASSAIACAGPSQDGDPAHAPSGAAEPADGLDKLTDEQLVRKLLEVTGSADLGKQVAASMLDTFRKMPNLPPGFIDRFKQNLRVEEVTELIVPIYLKHYNRPTMLAAVRFYQSEHGRTLVAGLPIVTAESTEAGKNWGGELAKRTLKDLGIEVPKSSP